jgi:zinc transport system substrate-binding protein
VVPLGGHMGIILILVRLRVRARRARAVDASLRGARGDGPGPRRNRFAAAALVLVLAASCGTDAGSGSPGDGLSIVASLYPPSEAAARVGGPAVAVTNLTPPGVEPHDLELDPEQVAEIADADLVLYLGEGFQPAVQDAVVVVAEGEHVDLLQGIVEARSTSEPGEPSGGGVVDPHVWLDPVLMRRIVDRISEALGRLDPANAVGFRKRADAFDGDLAELDEEYRSGLSSCRRRVLVTSHAAFGYLADRYGLTQEPITGLSPEAEPDPERLARLAADVRRTGTTTIFTETLVSPKVAQTLAREAGVATAVLNPLEGLTQQQEQADEDYLSVMRSNLAALRRGLDCA